MQYIQFLVGSRAEVVTSVFIYLYVYRPLNTKVQQKKELCRWSLPTTDNGRLIVIRNSVQLITINGQLIHYHK